MSEPTHVGSRQILGFAIWAGFVAGLLEGLAGVANQLVGRPMRVPVQILWIAPAVNIVLFAGAGLALAGFLRAARGAVRARLAIVALLWMLAFDLLLVADVMHPAAALVLALGLAMVVSRGRHPDERWLRFARRSRASVALGVLLCAVAGSVWPSWREARVLSAQPAADPTQPNVLLVTLDTLRADHVSAYGYARATTPHVDAFARRGALFEAAFANSSWTLPSHASILTGRLPHEHHADWLTPMTGSVPTLAEVLAARGYQTAAFAANTSYVAPGWGLGRGFSHFEAYGGSWADDVVRTAYGRRLALNLLPRVGDFEIPGRKRAADLNGEFLRWLDGVKGRPFFALLNYLDVHDPYLTVEPYRTQYSSSPARGDVINFQFQPHAFRRKPVVSAGEAQAEIDGYDGCLAYLDAQLGSLLDELARRGLDRDTIVIVTSDHGESFGNHDLFGHGNSAYFEALHVPLLVVWPGHVPAGVRVSQVVGLDRIAATIGDLLGAPGRAWPLPGHSLSPLWASGSSEAPEASEPVLSEVTSISGGPTGYPTSGGSLTSLVTTDWHLVVSASGAAQLFDWRKDPAEREDLSARPGGAAAVDELRRVMQRMSEARHP